MAAVGTTNITLNGLKANYVAGGQTNADGNSSLRNGSTTSAVLLSDFRNASFQGAQGTVAGSGAIAVSAFQGKTFGAAGGR